MSAPATLAQTEVLRLIARSIKARGYPPSIRELGKQLAITSTNSVADHLKALQKKGLIERDAVVARAIRVTIDGKLWLARVKP